MIKVLMLGVAKAVGTISRYVLSSTVHKYYDGSFLIGTFVINVVGCFLAGIVFVLIGKVWNASPELRIVILVGFFGAFTTFFVVYFRNRYACK